MYTAYEAILSVKRTLSNGSGPGSSESTVVCTLCRTDTAQLCSPCLFYILGLVQDREVFINVR